MNVIATKFAYLLELLEDIVKQDPPIPTDLLVCSTKEEILYQVLGQLNRHAGQRNQDEDNGQTDEPAHPTANHIFLSPSLYLLSVSQFCNVVFCPAIPVLRGYLSAYVPKHVPPRQSTIPPISPGGQMIILDLLALHHATSEFTLQGLSQTFATAVSAADRTKRLLRLVECKDVGDPSNPNRGSALWQSEVPLLSGSIRIGERGASWGRRTTSVIKVASRWFKFENEDHQGPQLGLHARGHERVSSEDEMLV
jgi:hypothetical protein